jgi:hypothetical protein
MAQVNYFFSTNMPGNENVAYTAPSVSGHGNATVGNLNSQTTTFASDAFELRVSTGTTGYLTPTKRDVENFLEMCHRWLHDSSQGLDALILANSGTVGVP